MFFRRLFDVRGAAAFLVAFLVAFLAAFFAAGLVLPLEGARAENDDVWALLKKPGTIVLLRHSYSPDSPEVEPKFGDCSTQRNLDESGRAQARRLGDEFRKRGINSATLVASQYCRAIETAQLTKLGPVRELPALNQVYMAGLRDAEQQGKQYMKTIPANQLTILVSHISNIQAIAGVNLSAGEAAVVHLDKSGAVVVDGRIMVK